MSSLDDFQWQNQFLENKFVKCRLYTISGKKYVLNVVFKRFSMEVSISGKKCVLNVAFQPLYLSVESLLEIKKLIVSSSNFTNCGIQTLN